MTIPIDLIEPDAWPAIRQRILEERAKRIGDLLFVATVDEMRRQQGYVEALDWVFEQGQPKKPEPQEEEGDC